MKHEFLIVPAGAGAGKTHFIQTTLVEWIQKGFVKPERILAVTFTEAAASELRLRIRSALVKNNMIEAALDIERSYISTIHSLGRRIHDEHAFAAEATPSPRILSEGERDFLIRQRLALASSLEKVAGDLPRFGYRYDHFSENSAEESFRSRVFQTVTLLRNLSDYGLNPSLVRSAQEKICGIYGAVEKDPHKLSETLFKAVDVLLKKFPESLEKITNTKTPKNEFKKNYRYLNLAKNSKERLEYDWGLWVSLSKLRRSNSRIPTPDGYDTLAFEVIRAAQEIDHHPGPRIDACDHIEALILGAQQILNDYAVKKQNLGLIDFSDMVTNTEKLLRNNNRVLSAVLNQIDCVIIDEFQDTNPSQFSLLWQLIPSVPRTIIVGDIKQAIMGFQGADFRLFQELMNKFQAQVKPLTENWRSDRRIMSFVNKLGPKLFGEAYQNLEPKSSQSPHEALEIIHIPKSRSARNSESRPEHHTAAHILRLLNDKNITIFDRSKKQRREIQPKDIAVLCPTHDQCKMYADALRSLGLTVRISGEGWWNSQVVLALRSAASIAHDPDDKHAVLCFATLGPPGISLESALKEIIEHGRVRNSIIEELQKLNERASQINVALLVSEIIEKGGFHNWVETLDDPMQSKADLIRFEAEADDFVQSPVDIRQSAGFFGFSAKVFLSWLEYRLQEKNFDQRPDPSGNAADGIEVVTWHASKGREWPIVVLACLDHDFGPRAGTITSIVSDYSDFNTILQKTQIEFTPEFDSSSVQSKFLQELHPKAYATACRLLYVALTRARERLILEWIEPKKLSEDEEQITVFDLLIKDAKVSRIPEGLAIDSEVFSAQTTLYADKMPLEFSRDRINKHKKSRIGRSAICLNRPKLNAGTPAIILPSQLEAPIFACPENLKTIPLGNKFSIPDTLFKSSTERGSALHEVVQWILHKPESAYDLMRVRGFDEELFKNVAKQAEALRSWISDKGYSEYSMEVQLEHKAQDGATIRAVLDFVARGQSEIAIIDHKSDQVENVEEQFITHWPQLSAYVDILRQKGFTDHKYLVGIHWMCLGSLSYVYV